jgi:hypothetical protein
LLASEAFLRAFIFMGFQLVRITDGFADETPEGLMELIKPSMIELSCLIDILYISNLGRKLPILWILMLVDMNERAFETEIWNALWFQGLFNQPKQFQTNCIFKPI